MYLAQLRGTTEKEAKSNRTVRDVRAIEEINARRDLQRGSKSLMKASAACDKYKSGVLDACTGVPTRTLPRKYVPTCVCLRQASAFESVGKKKIALCNSNRTAIH